MKKFMNNLFDKPITTCVVVGAITTSVVKIINALRDLKRTA